jgi:inner membrane protein
VLLAALYTVLYALLNLEDYALLVGTGLLLVVTIVLMYITRHINHASVTDAVPASEKA